VEFRRVRFHRQRENSPCPALQCRHYSLTIRSCHQIMKDWFPLRDNA
jgi:hypothetical protein